LPDTLAAAVQGAQYIICAAGGKGFWSAEAVDNKVGHLVPRTLQGPCRQPTERNLRVPTASCSAGAASTLCHGGPPQAVRHMPGKLQVLLLPT